VTRYRLPEALGGGEYEAVRQGGRAGVVLIGFDIPDVGSVDLPRSILVEVEEPPPPEPEIGAIVLADGRPWIHTQHCWPSWLGTGGFEASWKDLLGDYSDLPVRLVPDPAAGVVLPWRLGFPTGGTITVSRADVSLEKGVAMVSTPGPFVLGAADARSMAAALLAAADAAGVSDAH
jgi:hypothetical protein